MLGFESIAMPYCVEDDSDAPSTDCISSKKRGLSFRSLLAAYTLFELLEKINFKGYDPSLELTALFTLDKRLIDAHDFSQERLRHIKSLYKNDLDKWFRVSCRKLVTNMFDLMIRENIHETPFVTDLLTNDDITGINNAVKAALGVFLHGEDNNYRQTVQVKRLNNIFTGVLSSFASNDRGARSRMNSIEYDGSSPTGHMEAINLRNANELLHVVYTLLSKVCEHGDVYEKTNNSTDLFGNVTATEAQAITFQCARILTVLHLIKVGRPYEMAVYVSEEKDDHLCLSTYHINRLLTSWSNVNCRQTNHIVTECWQYPLDVATVVDPHRRGILDDLNWWFEKENTRLRPEPMSVKMVRARYILENWDNLLKE